MSPPRPKTRPSARNRHDEFANFVHRASADLFRTGYLMTGDAVSSEDLVQETFLRLARRWGRVSSMEHPLAYARRVLINLVLDRAPRRSRELEELAPDVADPAAELADESAACALRAVEDLDVFRVALARLAPRQRAVLVLRYWVDLSEAEIAEILGCPAGTVKSTASRATKRLAQLVASEGELSISGPLKGDAP